MNARKSIAFAAAVLITAAGMTGIVNYSNTAANGAHQAIDATVETIHTLPTINVTPTREQLRQLRGEQAGATQANLSMPYYSYASDTAGA